MKRLHTRFGKRILASVLSILMMTYFGMGLAKTTANFKQKEVTASCELKVKLSDIQKVLESGELLEFEDKLELPFGDSYAMHMELFSAMEGLLPVAFIDEEEYQAIIAVDPNTTELAVFFINKTEKEKTFRLVVVDANGNPVTLTEGSATAHIATIEELTEAEVQRHLEAGDAVELLGEFSSDYEDTEDPNEPLYEEEEPTDGARESADEATEPTDDAEEPAGEAENPANETDEPADAVTEPANEADAPAEGAEEIADEADELADAVTEPADGADEPADEAEESSDVTESAGEAENSDFEISEVYYNFGPTEAAETDASSGYDDSTDEAGDAANEAEEPADEAEEPANLTEEPADEAEEPADEAEEPADEAEEPAVEVEEPADEAEKPANKATGMGTQLKPEIPEAEEETVEAIVVKEADVAIGEAAPLSFVVATYNFGDTIVMVEFDPNNGEDVFFQVIGENGLCPEPSPPALKAGTRSFTGWYMDGADTPFDFSTTITESITLTARFSNDFLVMFKDASGYIYHSQLVPSGNLVAPPEQNPEPIGGAWFIGWKIDDPAEEGMFNFGTPITGNLVLIPVYSASYYVYFDAGDSAADPVLVVHGNKVPRPTDPQKAGYEFKFWSTNPNATSTQTGQKYDFDKTTVTNSFTLYAIWQPISVNYTLIYWAEKPDIIGDPGTGRDNYIFYSAYRRQATAGSTVDPTSLALSIPPHFEYRYGTPAYIEGDGTSVVNVYMKRIEYTITFEMLNQVKGPVSGKTYYAEIISGGKTYVEAEYKLVVKLGQDIRNTWPSAVKNQNGTYIRIVENEYGHITEYTTMRFTGFIVPKDIGIPSCSQNWVGDGTVVTSAMLPTQERAYTLTAVYVPSAGIVLRSVYHYLEPLPGDDGAGKEKRVYKGITYFLDKSHNGQFYGGTTAPLTPKGIDGMTCIGGEYIPYNDYFYFDRKSYKLTTYPQNGNDETEISYKFGEKLSAPADPVWAGHEFLGWYTREDCLEASKFDFTNATMPVDGLAVFAKWQANDYTATFYDKAGGQVVGTKGFAKDQYITPLDYYTVGQSYEGLGEFIGWYWYAGTSPTPTPFPFEAFYPKRNITLFGYWKTDGLKITYDINGGTNQNGSAAQAPVDPNEYKLGMQAPVADGSYLKKGSQVFAGWQVNGTGPVYYSNSTIKVSGHLHLVAMYVPASSMITITYYANYIGANPATKKQLAFSNTDITLEGASSFTRDGYTLVGWSTSPASGVAYELSAPYTVKDKNIELYAAWEEVLPFTITGFVFTESIKNSNGILEDFYHGIELELDYGFYDPDIVMKLYRAADADSDYEFVAQTIPDALSGFYEFQPMEDGTYYVEICGIAESHTLYEQIVDHLHGNKFDFLSAKTHPFQYVEGTTYICNAAVLPKYIGSIRLFKVGAVGSDNGMVKDQLQKHVFQIEFTPIYPHYQPFTFYEVLSHGDVKDIINLPLGIYTVTEMEDWAVDYEARTPYSYEISRRTPQIDAFCSHIHKPQTFFHAVDHMCNDFNSP